MKKNTLNGPVEFNKLLAVLFTSLFGYMYLQNKLTCLYLAVLSFKLMFQCCLSLDTISYEILDSVLRKKNTTVGENEEIEWINQSEVLTHPVLEETLLNMMQEGNTKHLQMKFSQYTNPCWWYQPPCCLVPSNCFFFTIKYCKWLYRLRPFFLPYSGSILDALWP